MGLSQGLAGNGGGSTGGSGLPAGGSNGAILGFSGGAASWVAPGTTSQALVGGTTPAFSYPIPLREQYNLRTAAAVESIPRWSLGASNQALASGTLTCTAIALPTALTIGHIATIAAAGALSTTHWWYGLYDNNMNQLATTADQGALNFTINQEKSLAIATIASGASTTFTTTYTGLYYVGVMMAASTPISVFSAQTSAGIIGGNTPFTTGTSDTNQTTPPAFPHAATALTFLGNTVGLYMWVGA